MSILQKHKTQTMINEDLIKKKSILPGVDPAIPVTGLLHRRHNAGGRLGAKSPEIF